MYNFRKDRKIETMSKLKIEFPIDQWKILTNSSEFVSTRIKTGRARKTFLSSFTRILSEKLQALGTVGL